MAAASGQDLEYDLAASAPDLGLERDPTDPAGDQGPGPEPGAAGPGGDQDQRQGRASVAGDQDPEAAAMAVCLRLLNAAPRTRAQLEQALRRRAVPPQAAEAVLDRLARGRLIDDTLFAEMWVESRHHSRGLARRALSAELRQRGVGEDDVRGAVAGLGPEQEEEAARRLVAGKLAATRGRPAAARMRRLLGVLARRGYPAGMAYRVVREALEQERATTGGGPDEENLPDDDLLPDADVPEEELPGAELPERGLPDAGI
jgi:regulatory protein